MEFFHPHPHPPPPPSVRGSLCRFVNRYEQEWGLKEAVAFQNELKTQLRLREDQIQKLNYDLSALQSNVQKMEVALRILRKECGKPDDWMPAGACLHCGVSPCVFVCKERGCCECERVTE